jgi:16S rRNA (guanine(1405)-N(7))-methyltransferase
MTAENCAGIIKASKKYNSFCDETILRISQDEIGKFKSDKDVVKSVKTKLHQITGAFIRDDDIKKAHTLLENISPDNLSDTVGRILALHASSAERMGFADELYRDIFAVTGEDGPIFDIACGFNPFYTHMLSGAGNRKYYATDINTNIISLLDEFFKFTGISGTAFAGDILYRIPDISVNNVFLFKILPLIEQQKKGYSQQLINQLSTEFITITFPTKSLSGKNVGMASFYGDFMESRFPADKFEYCFKKEYSNELLFIIRKKVQLG